MLPLLFLEGAWRILLIVLGVGAVIFFHEMGHFLVARWCGVRTEAFSLAFPPNLLVARRESGGLRVKWIGSKGGGFLLPFFKSERDPTEYRVGLIPLGGYVKMAGEGIGEGSGEPDELRSKSVGARAAIFSAGVVMNVIFAFLAFTVAFQLGVPLPPPVVGRIEAGGPAAAAGVRPGDRIVAIDGTPIETFMDIMGVVAHADGSVTIEVDRDGRRQTLPPVTPRYSEVAGYQVIGIAPAETAVVTKVADPALAAGLQPGDRIVAVAGTPVRLRSEIETAVGVALRARPETLALTVERPGKGAAAPTRSEVIVPLAQPAATRTSPPFLIGVSPGLGLLIREIPEGSPLRLAGLTTGDVVTDVGDKALKDASLEDALAQATGGTVGCTVRRGTVGPTTLTLPAAPDVWRALDAQPVVLVADLVVPGAAAEAGMRPGWLILEAAGQPVRSIQALQQVAGDSLGDPIRLGVLVPGDSAPRTVTLQPRVNLAALGLYELQELKEEIRLGFGGAIVAGWKGTAKFAEQVILTLQALVKRKVRADNLGGPIMIAVVAHDSTSRGLGAMLYFLGILSVNLAILNVLPIPVLDGGHLFFLLIEAVRRRPVSENIQIMAQYVGLLLLLGLMIFVTVNDIGRFF